MLLWSCVDFTSDRLLLNVLWTDWVCLGTRLEQIDLVSDFGGVYENRCVCGTVLIIARKYVKRLRPVAGRQDDTPTLPLSADCRSTRAQETRTTLRISSAREPTMNDYAFSRRTGTRSGAGHYSTISWMGGGWGSIWDSNPSKTESGQQESEGLIRLEHLQYSLTRMDLADTQNFGTRGSEVQILSPRPFLFKYFQNRRECEDFQKDLHSRCRHRLDTTCGESQKTTIHLLL